MSPQQGIGGRHRRRRERASVVTALPVALALACGVGTAQAAPQDFVTAPDSAQSGATDTTPVAPPPASTQEREFFIPPSPRVQQSQWRSYNDYQSGNQQSSYQTTYYEQKPTPTPAPQAAPTQAPPALQATPPPPPPVPTVQRTIIAPVDAPDGYILAGNQLVPYDPNLLDPNQVDRFNNTAAALQADGGNWLVDNGFADAPQADRIAAGTATGIIAGGATGLAASLVPATVITGTGAAIGGAAGAAASAASGAVVWGGPVGWVFLPGAGALAGAGIGAALSAPIVLGLTAAGAGIGGLIGATAAGGEQQIIEEPAPPVDPAPPAVDAVPATPAPLAVADPVQTAIADATATATTVFEQAPSYVGQATTVVADDPIGGQVLSAVDQAVSDAAPMLDQATAAVNDVLAGLPSIPV